jgi:hypothetical protein
MLNKLVVAIPATQTGKLVCESPKTQSIDAVKALLAFKKVACNPLPQEISLDDGRLVLVLSNKKDAYYVVTPAGCSCPAATYHPGQPCKHMTAYFKATSAEPLCDQVNSRAVREQFYASMKAAGAV